MPENVPQIDMSKGFDMPAPMTPMKRPQTLPQLEASAFTGQVQEKQPSFRGGGATTSFGEDWQTPETRARQEMKDQQSQEVVMDRVTTELDRRYGIDPANIEKIAMRASQEMGLPEDADPAKRALFYIQKNESNQDIMDEYKMGYFKKAGKDVVERAANYGKALAKIDQQSRKDMKEIGFGGPKATGQRALAALGGIGRVISTTIGEGVTGAAELADNLVTGGLADRKIYEAMESEGAKEIMENIAQSAPVERIMELAAEHPEAARDLGNVFDAGLAAVDVLTLGGASTLAKQTGKKIGSGIVGEGLERAGKAVMDLPEKGITAVKEALPSTIQEAGERAVKGVSEKTQAAKEFVNRMTDQAITSATGISPQTKAVALDPGELGNVFNRLKKNEVSTQDLFEDAMGKIRQAGEDVSDIGKGYNPIRDLDIKVDVSPVRKTIDDILSKNNIKVTKGKLDFSDSSIKNANSQRVVQEAFSDLYNRGEIKPDVALNLRSGLDDLVNYDTDVSPKGQSLVKKIRGEYDKIIKNKIPGLKDLDNEFKTARRTYDAAKKDFFNRDGSVKDGALSKFVNISKDRNYQRLNRLAELAPDAEDTSKAILAYEDLLRATGQKTASYASQALRVAGLGAVIGGGTFGGTEGLAAASPFGLALLALSNPRIMIDVLQQIQKVKGKVKVANKSAKNFANDMTEKVLNGKFTQADGEQLQKVIRANPKIQEAIGETAEEVVDAVPTKKPVMDTPETEISVEEGIEVRPDTGEATIGEAATVSEGGVTESVEQVANLDPMVPDEQIV